MKTKFCASSSFVPLVVLLGAIADIVCRHVREVFYIRSRWNFRRR